ncbi:hypothetical protein DFH06DRAFT_1335621 [Mycena polygramma]|nr:hypothetical protein DFH06DRAFT_1335621 [Mycena polygramma]
MPCLPALALVRFVAKPSSTPILGQERVEKQHRTLSPDLQLRLQNATEASPVDSLAALPRARGPLHRVSLIDSSSKACSVDALDVAVRKTHLLSQRDSETQSTLLGAHPALEILGGDRHCASTGTRRYCRTRRRTGSHTIIWASLCQVPPWWSPLSSSSSRTHGISGPCIHLSYPTHARRAADTCVILILRCPAAVRAVHSCGDVLLLPRGVLLDVLGAGAFSFCLLSHDLPISYLSPSRIVFVGLAVSRNCRACTGPCPSTLWPRMTVSTGFMSSPSLGGETRLRPSTPWPRPTSARSQCTTTAPSTPPSRHRAIVVGGITPKQANASWLSQLPARAADQAEEDNSYRMLSVSCCSRKSILRTRRRMYR